jgi:hypothetical protein
VVVCSPKESSFACHAQWAVYLLHIYERASSHRLPFSIKQIVLYISVDKLHRVPNECMWMEILFQKFASSCGRQHQLQRGLREHRMQSQYQRQQPQLCFTQHDYKIRCGVESFAVLKRRWLEQRSRDHLSERTSRALSFYCIFVSSSMRVLGCLNRLYMTKHWFYQLRQKVLVNSGFLAFLWCCRFVMEAVRTRANAVYSIWVTIRRGFGTTRLISSELS